LRCVLKVEVEIGHEVGEVLGEKVKVGDHFVQSVLHIPNLVFQRLELSVGRIGVQDQGHGIVVVLAHVSNHPTLA
jgi:hypothetical protein